MAALDLKSLIGRMDDHCRRALEAAAGLTLSRSHYNVEIEHWLIKLMDGSGSDVSAILRHYEVEEGRLLTDINRSMDKMKTGNARAPGLSPDVVEMAKQGWLLASVEHGLTRLRSGHLLWALLADDVLGQRAPQISGQLRRISPDQLKRDFLAITSGSAEASTVPTAAEGALPEPGADGAPRPAGRRHSTSSPWTSLPRRGPARSTRSWGAMPRFGR